MRLRIHEILMLVALPGVACFGLGGMVAATRPVTRGHLEVQSLSVLGSNGEKAITLQATESGPGVWLQNPNGGSIRLFAYENISAVFLFEKDKPHASIGMGMDTGGRPFLQYINREKKCRSVSLDEIIDAVEAVQPNPNEVKR